jgi:hypothetical protein
MDLGGVVAWARELADAVEAGAGGADGADGAVVVDARARAPRLYGK